jgi:hypothetical protein
VQGAFNMLAAVDLDDQTSWLTAKINDVGSDGHLAAKFQSSEAPIADTKP